MPETRPVAVYIDPPSHHFLGDRLFDAGTNPLAGEGILAPYLALRERLAREGITVRTADYLPPRPDGCRNIYLSVGRVGDYRALARRDDLVLSAFLAMECPVVEPSVFRALPAIARHVRRVMCFAGSEALLPFTGTRVAIERMVWPQCADGVNEEMWARADRRFLCMINSNKLPHIYRDELYTARLRAIEYFAGHEEIELYGREWDRAPWRVGRTWVPYTVRRGWRWARELRQRIWPHPWYAAAARAWRGTVASKAATLGRYTFAICFENMVLEGWITEKLFDCFYAGCVPVYWGAPDVADVVPSDAFIDMRAFDGFTELRRFLHGLSPAEVERYREAARAFVESGRYAPFRPTAFAERIAHMVRTDAQTGAG